MDEDSFYNDNRSRLHDIEGENESFVLPKLKFDDRSETSINVALKSHLKNKNSFASILNEDESFIKENPFSWGISEKIIRTINSTEFNTRYGKVLIFNPTSIYIAFGTNKGFIIVFNYRQEIEFVLALKENPGAESPISCMTFSTDSTFVANANEMGQIIIWNLSSQVIHTDLRTIEPYFIINPVNLDQRFNENKDGHLLNDKINNIKFIGILNLQLISSNTSGLIFYHYGFKKFMKKYFSTQKISGNNDTNAKNIKFLIHGMEVLPLSLDYNITDDMGIFAVLTSTSLTIMSLLSLNDQTNLNIRTHLVTGKPKVVDKSISESTGCIDWFPSVKRGNFISNPILAYSWNNVMTIVELDNKSFPDNFTAVLNDARDKDKLLPLLIINKTCRWVTHSVYNKIIGIKWLNSEILTVLTQNEKERNSVKIITFYYSKEGNSETHSLTEIGSDKLDNFEIISQTHTNTLSNAEMVKSTFYNLSISSVKERLMLLGMSHNLVQLKIGKAISWSDRLSNFLATQEYSKALKSAYSFYMTKNTGQLILSGLIRNESKRHDLIAPILLKIMFKSINKLIFPDKENEVSMLQFYYEVVATLYRDGYRNNLTQILDELFEAFNNRNIFFAQLEPFILSGNISELSPIILQNLVEYYVVEKDGYNLTEIICLLDMKSLDVDLTIQLCKKYKLKDCLIYIWNHVLGDYRTPLIEFLNDIQHSRNLEESRKVFPYISFILSGKQYPTDRFIDGKNEQAARESICKILFSCYLIPIDDEVHVETIFPYLYILLKFDSFETLTSLNEYFEESSLNGSDHINRQFIMEALLDIFETNEFSDFDRCQFAIFIARNYPKYPQFLRLPESVLNNTIETLCKVKDKNIMADCELALQSLISVYEPTDFPLLIEMVKAANFFNVLLSAYRAEGKYSKVVEIWLKKQERDDFKNNFDSLEIILENSLQQVKTEIERINLLHIIETNFSACAEYDITKFYFILLKYAPSLHKAALNLESPELRYQYLSIFFKNNRKSSSSDDNLWQFVTAFIKVSVKFCPNDLPEFLNSYGYELIHNEDELNECIELCKSENLHDCYTILFLQFERYEEALETLLKSIKFLLHDYDSSKDEEIQNCVHLAMEVCEKSEKIVEFNDDELDFSEKLWLSLIKCQLELSNTSKSVAQGLINKCVHDCFIKISELKLNHSNNNKQSFLKIFNSFLNDAAYDAATLLNIRGILQDVFISYSYESEMLQISFKMLNMSIYKSMQMIRAENLKGWSIKSKYCASCGRIMWGNSIDESHYSAWEDRQKSLLLLSNNNEVMNNHMSLVFFKCNHGYHFSCLEKLGYHRVKECAICT